MGAHMHHGIRAELLPQPLIERSILVVRRQVPVMVMGRGILPCAHAGRLQADEHIAQLHARDAVAFRIGQDAAGRLAPCCRDFVFIRQFFRFVMQPCRIRQDSGSR